MVLVILILFYIGTIFAPGIDGNTFPLKSKFLIDKEKFIQMIDEFYEHKGLDKTGVPKPETLKKLGLDKEPSHLV